MTSIRKKSKYYGKNGKKPAYDNNPNRRVQIPDWRFYSGIIEYIEYGAKENQVTRSRFFETVVKNYFLLNFWRISPLPIKIVISFINTPCICI